MSYASIQFVIFTFLVSIIYYMLPKDLRWWSILGGSIIFYMIICSWVIVFPLIGSFFAWFLVRIMPKEHSIRSKILLCIAISCNVITLLACKWGYWLYGIVFSNNILKLIVPVGISFYTLSVIGYCIDVYNQKTYKENNYARFLLFTLFFPYIIQGPIVKYSDVRTQLFANNEFEYKSYLHGWQLVLWGLIEKLVIADWLGGIVDTVFDSGGEVAGIFIFLGFVMYSFQLYLDFSGCVDIAIGTAQLFGIKLPQNFRQPYLAKSVKEFWQRWHISLSTWLRDYIYIPLGGSRKGRMRRIVNTMIVFAVSGVWHGVGLHYIIWGVLHGILVNLDAVLHRKTLKKNNTLFQGIKILITFFAVTFLWGIFRADSVAQFVSLLRNMLSNNNIKLLLDIGAFESVGIRFVTWVSVMAFLLIKIVIDILHERNIHIRELIDGFVLPIRWGIYIVAILGLLVFGKYGGGYSATAFIYGQF